MQWSQYYYFVFLTGLLKNFWNILVVYLKKYNSYWGLYTRISVEVTRIDQSRVVSFVSNILIHSILPKANLY